MSIAACAEITRKGDPDRFLATMAAPPATRELTKPRGARAGMDALDAMNVSDQRLADRLLRRRQEAGLTQKDLAHLAGIRVETLNRIEKARTTPDFKTIRKLVNAINRYNEET